MVSSQVVLGLGLATLRAQSARGAILVQGCGARLAGHLEVQLLLVTAPPRLLVAVAAGTSVTSPLVHWVKKGGRL